MKNKYLKIKIFLKENKILIINIFRGLKNPILFTFLLAFGLVLSEVLIKNRIANSLVIMFISLVYLYVVIYENKTKGLLEKVVNFTLFTLVSSPLIVYSIILLMKVISPSLERIGDQSSWIGFYGSLISGSLIMFSLVFTIEHDKRINANQSIPVLEMLVDDSLHSSNIIVQGSYISKDSFRISPEILIKLHNKSNFAAYKIKIKNIMVQNYELYYELEHRSKFNKEQINSISYKFNNVPIIFPNSEVEFSTYVDEIVFDGGVLVINADIEYTDAYNINFFTVSSRIEFFINIDKETVLYNNPEDSAYRDRNVTLKLGTISCEISKIQMNSY